MQRDKRFHIGLAPLLADILPAVSRLPDMVRIEPVYIHIRQTAKTRKDEHTPCQFHVPVLKRCSHQAFQLVTADMFQSGRVLLLVFDFLDRVGAYNLPVHGKVQQPVEPAQALVHLVRAAFQIFQ